jgi:hypothetical protein
MLPKFNYDPARTSAIGKSQRVGVEAGTPNPLDKIGTAIRLHIAITVWNDIEMHADLDSGAEVDIVSHKFAQQYGLRRAPLTGVIILAINQRSTPTYGVWIVPITATDSRGTARTFERCCLAIDRDPRLEESPVLLSMTTVRDEYVDLLPYKLQWWYVAPSYSIATPHQFEKECRNYAYVYAMVKLPEVWLPGDDQETPLQLRAS